MQIVLGEQVVGFSLKVGAQGVGQSLGLPGPSLEEAHGNRLPELGTCEDDKSDR